MGKKNISLFTVSFRQGFISPNLPIATFYQEDKKIVFLLDSGSDKNVIDSNAIKLFEHKVKDDAEETHLSGVGGTQKVYTASLAFGTKDEKYTADFLVTDLKETFDLIEKEHGIAIHGIIGSSFLREHHVVLDFKNLAAYSKQ